MGANLSSEENFHQQRRRSSHNLQQQNNSKYVMGKKSSSSSSTTQSQSIIQHSIDLVSNNSNNYIIDSSPNVINATTTTTMGAVTPIITTPPSPTSSKSLALISEKSKGKLPVIDALNHLDKLSPINNNSSIIIDRHSSSGFSSSNKRKSQQQRAASRNSHHPRERYSSILSASGFSTNNNDGFQFSTIAGDSVITDMSRFSFNSYNMDHKQLCDDNDYIMSVPDFEYPSRTETTSPSTDNVSTMEEILDLLKQHPGFTYDILTDIFSSARIRNNVDLQREAFQAAEVWSLRPDDVSAKICVARCKLCGWGTSKNPRQGFKELQQLAEKNNWEAYYHLAQCYYYGVEQVSEGYTLNDVKSPSMITVQPIDQTLACSWYKKVIATPCDIRSDRIAYIIAQAKLLIAVTNFTTDQITRENFEENMNYIKDSASAGNR
jgi:hypothetical protein